MRTLRIGRGGHAILLRLSVFAVLFCSGTVMVQLLGTAGRCLFWLYGLILLLFFNGGLSRQNAVLICAATAMRSVIVIAQMIAGVPVDMASVNSILDMALSLNAMAQIAQRCTPEEFAQEYVAQMSWISTVSMVLFAIQLSPLRSRIPAFAKFDGLYIHSYIHLWGWDNNVWRTELFSRNAGPWWEPGAFQCFIAMAMLMIMSGRCSGTRRLRGRFLILLAAWITTQSTTGYIIMGMLLILMFRRIPDLFCWRSFRMPAATKKAVAFLIAAGLALLFLAFVGWENLREKFSGSNSSAAIRFMDVLGSLEISMVRPLCGVGENLAEHYARFGIENNSAALLTLCMSNGWPYLMAFCTLLFAGIRRFFAREYRRAAWGAGVILLLMTMTEGIVSLPIMFVYFVHYREKAD